MKDSQAVIDRLAALELVTPPEPWYRGDGRTNVLKTACDLVGISVADCLAKSRKKAIVEARFQVMWLLFTKGWSTVMISRTMDLHHTSVMYGVGVIKMAKAKKEKMNEVAPACLLFD